MHYLFRTALLFKLCANWPLNTVMQIYSVYRHLNNMNICTWLQVHWLFISLKVSSLHNDITSIHPFKGVNGHNMEIFFLIKLRQIRKFWSRKFYHPQSFVKKSRIPHHLKNSGYRVPKKPITKIFSIQHETTPCEVHLHHHFYDIENLTF